MNIDKNIPKFFLGSNSPCGFFSYFDNLYNPNDSWFCYILKGGPGSGKSSIMKKIATHAVKNNISVELIYCPSDPNSLDAVILPEMKVSVVDGTAPHTIDPIYPGVSDKIINLGEYWNEKLILNKKDEIIKLSSKNLLFRTRASGYLNACQSIKHDIANIVSTAVNNEKTLDYCKRLSKKLFKRKSDCKGVKKIRFISAITPKGIIFFEDTILSLCEQIYVIDDCFNIISPIVLDYIENFATKMGYNVIKCFCPIDPKTRPECLIFPQNGIAFAVSNQNHPIENLKSISKKINSRRFLNKKIISSHLRLLNFDRKIERQLLMEAINNLNRAKSIHDSIEQIYVPCMNFKSIDNLSKNIIDTIF